MIVAHVALEGLRRNSLHLFRVSGLQGPDVAFFFWRRNKPFLQIKAVVQERVRQEEAVLFGGLNGSKVASRAPGNQQTYIFVATSLENIR